MYEELYESIYTTSSYCSTIVYILLASITIVYILLASITTLVHYEESSWSSSVTSQVLCINEVCILRARTKYAYNFHTYIHT